MDGHQLRTACLPGRLVDIDSLSVLECAQNESGALLISLHKGVFDPLLYRSFRSGHKPIATLNDGRVGAPHLVPMFMPSAPMANAATRCSAVPQAPDAMNGIGSFRSDRGYNVQLVT